VVPFRSALACILAASVTGCGADSSTAPGPEKPARPNDVHLQSDAGDYIGAGKTYSYDQSDAVMAVTASGGYLTVSIDGDQSWEGQFQSPSGMTQLKAGTYPNLQRYPFHDPAVGGLSWDGNGRGCNTLSGSFTIDSVTYATGVLTKIDLSFEQYCDGATGALRGTVHWAAGDTTSPPGPVNPLPSGLWRPIPGSTPVAARYVYLESDGGDYIGQGSTYTYTQPSSSINVSATGGHISVGGGGWAGDFQTMNSIKEIQAGYYPGLHRYPFNNPTKGGLDWFGNGAGCNTLVGWFVVDRVTYTGGALTALDLRFEQHCEGSAPALHGVIHLGG
jgi:hypothetical protein